MTTLFMGATADAALAGIASAQRYDRASGDTLHRSFRVVARNGPYDREGQSDQGHKKSNDRLSGPHLVSAGANRTWRR